MNSIRHHSGTMPYNTGNEFKYKKNKIDQTTDKSNFINLFISLFFFHNKNNLSRKCNTII